MLKTSSHKQGDRADNAEDLIGYRLTGIGQPYRQTHQHVTKAPRKNACMYVCETLAIAVEMAAAPLPKRRAPVRRYPKRQVGQPESVRQQVTSINDAPMPSPLPQRNAALHEYDDGHRGGGKQICSREHHGPAPTEGQPTQPVSSGRTTRTRGPHAGGHIKHRSPGRS